MKLRAKYESVANEWLESYEGLHQYNEILEIVRQLHSVVSLGMCSS